MTSKDSRRSLIGLVVSMCRLVPGREIPPGGMDVPLFEDAATDECHRLLVAWADCLRWHGCKRALELPGRPDLADPRVGDPIARRLAYEVFDEARRPR
jgi:hypothetical protein